MFKQGNDKINISPRQIILAAIGEKRFESEKLEIRKPVGACCNGQAGAYTTAWWGEERSLEEGGMNRIKSLTKQVIFVSDQAFIPVKYLSTRPSHYAHVCLVIKYVLLY